MALNPIVARTNLRGIFQACRSFSAASVEMSTLNNFTRLQQSALLKCKGPYMNQVVNMSGKPRMRGLLSRQIAKHLCIMFVINVSVVSALKVYLDGRKTRYGNYYKNLDREAEFNRMKDLGLFQSAK